MRSDVFEGEAPADYLARLAALPFGKAYKSLALRELAIAEGHVVVDLGCGPGADLEAFAAATGPSGAVIGVDSDPKAVRAAVRSQRERPWVQVQPGDIHSVVLPDAGLMRAYRGFVVERVIRNPGIGRQLARLATDAGFGSTRVVPVTSVFDDVTEADKVFGFERVTRRAVAAGYLDPQAAEA
jgi:ubiquinone/menaquinone biosynthesis C-methylase UbiE